MGTPGAARGSGRVGSSLAVGPEGTGQITKEHDSETGGVHIGAGGEERLRGLFRCRARVVVIETFDRVVDGIRIGRVFDRCLGLRVDPEVQIEEPEKGHQVTPSTLGSQRSKEHHPVVLRVHLAAGHDLEVPEAEGALLEPTGGQGVLSGQRAFDQ